MKFLRRAGVLLGLAVLAFAGGRTEASAPSSPDRIVILVSMDGVSPELLAQARTPVLNALEARGTRADRLVPPFPSNTFPAHASMSTGCFPDKHGIVSNKFVDRRRGPFQQERPASWLRAEPLWATAERQGVRAGVVMWPNSEGDWRGRVPTHLMKFGRHVDDRKKVDRILDWFSRPERERPRLVMAWFRGSDSEGHRFGPGSPEEIRALEREDVLIGRMEEGLARRGLLDRVVLFVVSDHGVVRMRRVVNLARMLKEAGIPARVASANGISHVYLDAPWEIERAERVLANAQGIRLYRRDALPGAWNALVEDRVGDLVAVGEPGVWFSEGSHRITEPTPSDRRGGHGYEPGVPGTNGILVAAGPGVRSGARISGARDVDVHPTVCRLLGIRPAEGIDGGALDALLDPPAVARDFEQTGDP